jgi:hypothetical protein
MDPVPEQKDLGLYRKFKSPIQYMNSLLADISPYTYVKSKLAVKLYLEILQAPNNKNSTFTHSHFLRTVVPFVSYTIIF